MKSIASNKSASRLAFRLIVALVASIALLPRELWVQQEAQGQDLGRTRQRLQELQSQIGQLDNQLSQLRKRRQGVLVELQGITLRTSKARAQAEAARLNLEQTQRELRALNKRKTDIHRELDLLKVSLRRQARRLKALGPLGTLSFFPSYADVESFLVRSRYLEWWRNNETRNLRKAVALHTELTERETEITAAEAIYSKVGAEMASLQETLRANERRLREYLDSIQQDEQLKKGLQAELKEESVLLERMLAALISKSRAEDAYQTAVPFHSLAGRLKHPVEGALAEGFGVQTHPRFGTKTMNTGLLIAAEGGTPVRAVADGRVVMAEAYQSYGLMVIIDHGDSYYTLYTYLRAISVQKGQAVRSGETLGYVGDTPDGSRLGFEIRRQTTPEDPQKWLASKYVKR
ncbi:MAG: peptidoglycan DD-metalloendopeptidase family protein [Holophagales bacterium]|jgi:septal ring factor EnvC (AmiA/AmiB activator)|nr:peptidoglycan DD-metalloendopeptidase family protein [Holophagales bacterium]